MIYIEGKIAEKFKGQLMSCEIISSNLWRGPLPSNTPRDIEVNCDDFSILGTQKITFTDTVNVETGIKWTHNTKPLHGKINRLSYESYAISIEDKSAVFELISHAFTHNDIESAVVEPPDVKVLLTNEKGQTFIYEFMYDSIFNSVSTVLRQIVGIPSLLLFDGQGQRDSLTSISIDMRKNIYGNYEDRGVITYNLAEPMLDIAFNSYQFSCVHDSHSQILDYRTLYNLQKDINNYLGEVLFELEDFVLGKSHHFEQNPSKDGVLTITLEWETKGKTVFIGNFNNAYLPEWYKHLITIMSAHTGSTTLMEFLPTKQRGKQSIYKYCSIYIFKVGKEYFYRTDRGDIHAGDIVKVPFGGDNVVRTGRVESVSFHNKSNVPYDLMRTKFIIDKEANDIDDSWVIYDEGR